jgi:hypothetical protein
MAHPVLPSLSSKHHSNDPQAIIHVCKVDSFRPVCRHSRNVASLFMRTLVPTAGLCRPQCVPGMEISSACISGPYSQARAHTPAPSSQAAGVRQSAYGSPDTANEARAEKGSSRRRHQRTTTSAKTTLGVAARLPVDGHAHAAHTRNPGQQYSDRHFSLRARSRQENIEAGSQRARRPYYAQQQLAERRCGHVSCRSAGE